jgi:hypothetical protein
MVTTPSGIGRFDKIVLTPTDGELAIEVHGALAGILNVAQRDGHRRRCARPKGGGNWPVSSAS